MTYLLDTNVIRALFDAQPLAVARAEAARGAGRVVISVVVGEVHFGLERLPAGRRREQIAGTALGVLGQFDVIGIEPAVANVYASIKNATQRGGRMIGDNELWIAATALHLDATLVTNDRDLDAVDGLRREDWSA